VVKQSFFGLPGQYDRRVTKANYTREITFNVLELAVEYLFIIAGDQGQ